MSATAAPTAPDSAVEPPGTPEASAVSSASGEVLSSDASSRLGGAPAAHLQRIADAWRRLLPPADIMDLDGGYLVARRRDCQAQQAAVACKARSPLPAQPAAPQQHGSSLLSMGPAAAAPAAWTAAQEQRYQRMLTLLRLIAQSRLKLPRQAYGGEARFVAALAAAALTARTLRSLPTLATSQS
ncbi:hypothetical protein ABPG75_008394 [Micractinium tetrahymenae]